jgi:hypothetical protein
VDDQGTELNVEIQKGFNRMDVKFYEAEYQENASVRATKTFQVFLR